jgi:thiamine kinase-like enzyme
MSRALPDAELLRSVLGSRLGRIVDIVPLDSGTTGRSYRVETTARRFAAKIFSPETDALLGPRAQFDLLTRLAPTGVAPLPAACDESAGVLVTAYFDDAAAVGADEFRRAARIHAVGKILVRLHRSGIDAPKLEPEKYARRHFSRLGGLDSLSLANRERGYELLGLAASLDFDAACLCHNDLIADNILFGQSQTLKLIDFDYAALAPPILDLVSVSVMNDFGPNEEVQLLQAYGADSKSPNFIAEFARVKRFARLLFHFWSLASSDAGAAIVSRYRIDDV